MNSKTMFALAPEVLPIAIAIPKGADPRMRPAGMKASVNFGLPWPDHPNVKKWQAAFPHRPEQTQSSRMPQELVRCAWAAKPDMWAYHDREWGTAIHDDRKHFEFMILEGAQAGLSWSTILNKREGYRRCFADFDPEKVARFTPARIAKVLLDPGIVRNRLKVESGVHNAKLFLALQDELGSFDEFIWSFVGGKPIVNRWKRSAQVPATTKQSDALGAAMKARGFKFAGSTIMYAHMQACGLVDDHLVTCFRCS